nr:glutamate receptor 2.2-like [Ipomoea batatas]
MSQGDRESSDAKRKDKKDNRKCRDREVAESESTREVVQLLNTEEVHGIVGSEVSTETFVAELGSKAHVPLISLTPRSLSHVNTASPYMIQITPDDSYQAQAIESICKQFKWLEDVIFGSCAVGIRLYVPNSENLGIRPRNSISMTLGELLHRVGDSTEKNLTTGPPLMIIVFSNSTWTSKPQP